MPQDDAHWMRLAIQLATENVTSGNGGPFGAVIVRDGELVAAGANQVTSSNDPTAHAEIVAIRAASQKLAAFELTGCRIFSSCEPCPMCLGAILWSRLDGLVYGATAADAAAAGFDDAAFYEQIRLPPAERKLPSSNLLRDEASASFAAWREAASRISY